MRARDDQVALKKPRLKNLGEFISYQQIIGLRFWWNMRFYSFFLQ